MAVPLSEQHPESDEHQQHGNEVPEPEALAEDGDADQGTDKRSRGKKGGLSCHANQSHRVDREDDAESVAHETEEEPPVDDPNRRHFVPNGKRNPERDGAAEETFQLHDGERVAEGKPLREIVVECPPEARSRNREHTPHVAMKSGTRNEGERGCTEHDEKSSDG